MKKYNDFDDYEIELDDDILEEFGEDLTSVVDKQIKNPSKKKNNDKLLKFHKDGHFERNQK